MEGVRLGARDKHAVGFDVIERGGRDSEMKQDVIRYSLEVGSEASSHTALLCGSVNTNKDQVGFKDALVYIGREEEVATSALLDHIYQAWFVDGQSEIWAIPGIDASLVQIDDGDCYLGALQCDHGTSGTTLGEESGLLSTSKYAIIWVATHRRSQHQLSIETTIMIRARLRRL